ncbi:unnamed protein product [Linum trigynum]|uniref:Uncharacterized protein n=1 Tax=Linum trigynum TaxID=586398 RepID=A0AAV2G0B0_9ROSI
MSEGETTFSLLVEYLHAPSRCLQCQVHGHEIGEGIKCKVAEVEETTWVEKGYGGNELVLPTTSLASPVIVVLAANAESPGGV